LNKPVVAAFDFDKTITTCDTFFPFLTHTVGYFRTGLCLLVTAPALFFSLFSPTPRQKAKEIVLSWFFKGMPATEFQKKADHFAEHGLHNYLRPIALKRIQWHRQQGHRCVLVSASVENYIYPWASKVGFQDTLASRLAITPSGTISGLFMGRNCRGHEKVRRLEELLGPRSSYTLYAYGDSKGDREMLALADFSFYQYIP
jgi:phosphatidylglycerophosphatase C